MYFIIYHKFRVINIKERNATHVYTVYRCGQAWVMCHKLIALRTITFAVTQGWARLSCEVGYVYMIS